MTAANPLLAEVLDQGAANEDGGRLVAAIVDAGVLVPVDANGSVVFLAHEDGGPLLPGYTDERVCGDSLPGVRPVLCDALRLLDIAAATKVERLAVFAASGWAVLPMVLVAKTLEDRGLRTIADQKMMLARSSHPVAIALRDALASRLLDFPEVMTVWIAHARWLETGQEQLFLHILLSPQADSRASGRLMNVLLEEDVVLGEGDPRIGVRVLDASADAKVIAELDAMKLDTVRADHIGRKVHLISTDYDRG